MQRKRCGVLRDQRERPRRYFSIGTSVVRTIRYRATTQAGRSALFASLEMGSRKGYNLTAFARHSGLRRTQSARSSRRRSSPAIAGPARARAGASQGRGNFRATARKLFLTESPFTAKIHCLLADVIMREHVIEPEHRHYMGHYHRRLHRGLHPCQKRLDRYLVSLRALRVEGCEDQRPALKRAGRQDPGRTDGEPQ